MKKEKIAQICGAYHQNFVSDLVAFTKDFGGLAYQYLTRDKGYDSIRPIYLEIISMIPAEGIRLSNLALLLDMNVQHCMDLLNEFEETGFVRRTEDPDDSRARLISLTKKGKSFVYDAIEFGKTRDPYYQKLMTPERFLQFETLSGELNDKMGFDGLRSRQYPEYLDKAGSPLYGNLFQIEAYCHRLIHRHLDVCGHVGAKESIQWLVGQLSMGQTNIAQIAELRGISVQAMGRIVKEAEAAGYVKGLTDTADKRRKTLLLTERGIELLGDIIDAVNRLEFEFGNVIGKRKFLRFKTDLAALSESRPSTKLSKQSSVMPTLIYRENDGRAIELEDGPLTMLQTLVLVAYLLDQTEPASSAPTVTQSIHAQSRGGDLLMLTPDAVAKLNTTTLSLDDVLGKLKAQVGKKAIDALVGQLSALRQLP